MSGTTDIKEEVMDPLRAAIEARVWEEAAAFCNQTPGLVLNGCNALEFENRARQARERANE